MKWHYTDTRRIYFSANYCVLFMPANVDQTNIKKERKKRKIKALNQGYSQPDSKPARVPNMERFETSKGLRNISKQSLPLSSAAI